MPLGMVQATARELTPTVALRLLRQAETQLSTCIDGGNPRHTDSCELRAALLQHYHSHYQLGQPRIQLNIVADPSHVPAVRSSGWCHVLCWAVSASYMAKHEWRGRALRQLSAPELKSLTSGAGDVRGWAQCLGVLLDRGQGPRQPLPIPWPDLVAARREFQAIISKLRAGGAGGSGGAALEWFRRHVINGAWRGLQRCFWAQCYAEWLAPDPAAALAEISPLLEVLTNWYVYLSIFYALLGVAAPPRWDTLLDPAVTVSARAFRERLWGDGERPRVSDRVRDRFMEICCAQNLTGCAEENYRTVFGQGAGAAVKPSAVMQKLGGQYRRECLRTLAARASPDPGAVWRLGQAHELCSDDPLDELDLALLEERLFLLHGQSAGDRGLVLLPTSVLRCTTPVQVAQEFGVLPDTLRPRPVLVSAFGAWLGYEPGGGGVVLCGGLAEAYAWLCLTLQSRYRGRLQDGTMFLDAAVPLRQWLASLPPPPPASATAAAGPLG